MPQYISTPTQVHLTSSKSIIFPAEMGDTLKTAATHPPQKKTLLSQSYPQDKQWERRENKHQVGRSKQDGRRNKTRREMKQRHKNKNKKIKKNRSHCFAIRHRKWKGNPRGQTPILCFSTFLSDTPHNEPQSSHSHHTPHPLPPHPKIQITQLDTHDEVQNCHSGQRTPASLFNP